MVGVGGFTEAITVKSSDPTLDVSTLKTIHEEANICLMLHCIHAKMDSMDVFVCDTDILVLLVAHYDKMGCSKLFMKAGTSKLLKHISVHEI
jgi:hypothetical protein